MASWEDARLCPGCKVPGAETGKRPAPSGDGVLVSLQCENEKCPDFKYPFYVQVRRDGSIPDPTVHTRATTGLDKSLFNEALAQQVRDAIHLQNQLTAKPGGAEIGNQW